MKQIALPLSLDRQFSFENFVSTRAELIVESLKSLLDGRGESQIGLWGTPGSGKTHLLNACADHARKEGIGLQIYDAVQLARCEASDFDGGGDCDVLAIDNLDAIAGNAAWEAFFYQAINRCRGGDFRFLFSLGTKPDGLACRLDDFRSRLQWGLMLRLPASGDAEVREILRRRADLLGFELSDEVISYLMNRYARDLPVQMAILQRLDGASLSQQRRITIPLVRQALGDSADAVSPASTIPGGGRNR